MQKKCMDVDMKMDLILSMPAWQFLLKYRLLASVIILEKRGV